MKKTLAAIKTYGQITARVDHESGGIWEWGAQLVRASVDAFGQSAYDIARDLNKDAVPTAQRARAWSQATVRALLMREGVL